MSSIMAISMLSPPLPPTAICDLAKSVCAVLINGSLSMLAKLQERRLDVGRARGCHAHAVAGDGEGHRVVVDRQARGDVLVVDTSAPPRRRRPCRCCWSAARGRRRAPRRRSPQRSGRAHAASGRRRPRRRSPASARRAISAKMMATLPDAVLARSARGIGARQLCAARKTRQSWSRLSCEVSVLFSCNMGRPSIERY